MGLFDEQVARKPNLYPWTQEFIDRIWAGHWTPNEFNFRGDFGQFKSDLNDTERGMIVNCLSAIGQVEIAVKTFWARLGDNFPHPSMYDLGYAMANTEVIHNQAYEKLLDVLHLGDVFEENLKNPIVKGRIEYLRKYLKKVYGLDERKQYVYAIILFTLFVENVSLFSQFYVILWFNRFRNVLKDTAQQVQYTRNEEMLHAQVGIRLINTLREEYPDLFDDGLLDRILLECASAFEAESQIIDWMVGDFEHENLSAPLLKTYIKGRFNDSLRAIGFPTLFDLSDDAAALEKTKWMDEEAFGNNMTDFFHKRPVEYSKKSKSYSEEDIF
jgi:ribonucleoside-diphosphate reductase beta chain